jgi:hypothetical protein
MIANINGIHTLNTGEMAFTRSILERWHSHAQYWRGLSGHSFTSSSLPLAGDGPKSEYGLCWRSSLTLAGEDTGRQQDSSLVDNNNNL